MAKRSSRRRDPRGTRREIQCEMRRYNRSNTRGARRSKVKGWKPHPACQMLTAKAMGSRRRRG